MGLTDSASIDIVARLLDGSLPGLARFGWPLVNVRDIADLHLRAMTAPDAAGQRYIGAGPSAWMGDIARVLRERTPSLATQVPRRRLPDVLVRLSGRSTLCCGVDFMNSVSTDRCPQTRLVKNPTGCHEATKTRSWQPP